MSSYIFSPMPPTDAEHNTFVTWSDGFTVEELDLIEQYCENTLTVADAVVGKGTVDADIRISKTAWISLTPDTEWFYDRMAWIARKLNSQFYRFDLTGFLEDFQYTIYDGSETGHYDWHIDSSSNDLSTRKFSMVLQLSESDTYEGGDLEIMAGNIPDVVKKQRGMISAFPAYRVHRVTPVTKGIRKTIVVWIAGPPFK